jgi:hypothetical protein
MANPVTNLVQNVKAQMPFSKAEAQKPEMSFLGHIEKPKGGCEGCKGCGCCGKKADQGKQIDFRG